MYSNVVATPESDLSSGCRQSQARRRWFFSSFSNRITSTRSKLDRYSRLAWPGDGGLIEDAVFIDGVGERLLRCSLCQVQRVKVKGSMGW